MRGGATLLAAAALWLVVPGGPARARAQAPAPEAAPLPAVPLGRVVLIELNDGTRLRGRVVRITATGVVIQRSDGMQADVPWEQIRRVALGSMARPRAVAPWIASPRTRRAARRHRPWQPSNFYIEFLGLRVTAGFVYFPSDYGYDGEIWPIGGFEVTLFTLHWRHFYWETFRGILTYPMLGIGTAAGVPIRLDRAGRHELRVGAHLSANFSMIGEGAWPILGASGGEVYYQYRMYKRFAIQFGLMQHSRPAGLTVFFGFSL